MSILTERLQIIPCTFENVAEFGHNYEIGPHIHMYLEELERDSSYNGWGVWFVILKDTNEVIGDIGFKGKPLDGQVEIGYGIIPTAQNKGYATEAVQGLIDWAFSSGKVEKIIAECLIDNAASIKVLEKVGMTRSTSNNEMLFWEIVKN
ncbi:GNAT family N-acetyltransferase [Cytobacillus sp. FJAT-54145]|uniref:GNAT family N-acetyltransferase n=1 Tax=Cytobacillus spartinae TaxID=3299023 RepID=A0ABW6KFT7_9BACI